MELASQYMILDFGLEALASNKPGLNFAPELSNNTYCPYISESWSFGILMMAILFGQQSLQPLKILKNSSKQELIDSFVQ
jgi:hypothetical protein